MFKEFYSFSENPFTLEPDPRFFFLTESHRKLLFSLMYGIKEKKGFTLLLGETGIGKTTFIRHLLSMLGPHIKPIPIFAPPKTFDELLEVILRELKLPLEEGNGNSRLFQLNEYLYQRSAQNETLLIIVDEAQNLSKELLEQLRQLCNPDPKRSRFLKGFLVGEADIADKLDSWDLRALKQRIVMRSQLGPLTEEESRRYIEHRLKEVGSNLEAIFTSEAAALICRHSRGIPRVIHMLCSLALSTGYVLSQKKIDAPFIKRILPLLQTQKPSVMQRMESLTRIFADRLRNSPRIIRTSYALPSEKKFKTLAENMPEEEVEGKKSLMDFFDQRNSERIAEYLATQGANRGAVMRDAGCQLLDKNGDIRDVSLTLSMFPETKKSVAPLMDITETKRTEERIEELKEIYLSLIQNTNEGIALVQNGILKFANPKIFEILGYPREELISKPFREFIFPKDRERFEIQPDEPTNGDLNPTSSIRMIHKDGGVRWLENKGTLVHWGKDKAVLHFLTDQTHRKQAEEELRKSIEPFRRLIDTLDKFLIASNGNV
jgi:general secretion pathway protein A